MQGSGDAPAHGVVELREDVPLKGAGGAGGGARWCAGGPRLIIACFGALTAAITLALFTQIYYGDYELVPHGSVSSSGAACSRAGTDALKAGGRAADAAVAAALCLAVTAPHLTSLDASGSLLYWEYRQLRTQQPTLVEWGGAGSGAGGGERPPRLVRALAAMHAQYGALPWPSLLQAAVQLAREGFPVSAHLARALAEEAGSAGGGSPPPPPAGSLSTAPDLAAFLETLQHNTSAELTMAWGPGGVRVSSPAPYAVGAARLWAGGVGAQRAQRACAAALTPPPASVDEAQARVVEALVADVATESATGAGEPPASAGVATGLAVIDHLDTYLALVTGLSVPFGSGPSSPGAGPPSPGAGPPSPGAGPPSPGAGWTQDLPTAELDLAPAIMADQQVCGSRFVAGAAGGAALAQVCAALGAGGGAGAVERARLVLAGPRAQPEPPGRGTAVNLVQQVGDSLLSHADSRGGGLASRF